MIASAMLSGLSFLRSKPNRLFWSGCAASSSAMCALAASSATAGGEFGIRGYIEATDLNTGKAAWRTYTIPGAGEPGNETWKDGKERWKHGGGSVWETATYDPDSDTFYRGTGNAGPDYDIAYRPGDNKWAASVLALSPSDGKIKWGFQYTPQDPYDYRCACESSRRTASCGVRSLGT